MMKPRTRSRLATLGIVIVALILSIMPGIAPARQHIGLASSVTAPVFSFPTNGTSYPSNGPYLFQVQPVSGVTGYLWSFVQNGMIVYQNLAWDGHLSPASYTVSTSSKAHSLIHSGDLHVWVRALMKNGQWSSNGAVMVRIQGKGNHASPPTPQPKPTAGPPAPGTILYQGLTGWSASQDWKFVGGMLVNDGTNQDELKYVTPPYSPGSIANYAVEADIQAVHTVGYGQTGFGIIAREGSTGGYWAGYDQGGGYPPVAFIAPNGTTVSGVAEAYPRYWSIAIAKQAFDPGTDWHSYRLEVRGNSIKFLIDGNTVINTSDNSFLSGGKVGLWSFKEQISVRSFKVIAL